MEDKEFQSLSKPQQETVMKIAAEAERQGVNPKLAIAVAHAETGGTFSQYRGNKVLTSPAGARGVMQIMPETAQLFNKKLGLNINPDDEDSNIMGGVAILKDHLKDHKSPRKALAFYNASPAALQNYVKYYDSDPDKAIMSLPAETHGYLLKVSKNFNLDDDTETGLLPDGDATKKSPFESYQSAASQVKEEERVKKTDEANPEDKQGGITNEQRGALVGAGANVLLSAPFNPKFSPKVDTGKAEEANLSAQDKLALSRRELNRAAPQGMDDLEDAYRQNQYELDNFKNEQRLAQERLRGLPKALPVTEMPAVTSELPSQKKADPSGAVKWVHEMADGVPDTLANRALNMRADNPRGGQAIIDADMAARTVQERLGLGDYGLTTTAGGVELALPPTTVAERQAEIARQTQESQAELEQRNEQNRIQQQAQAQQLEQQRLAHETELDSLRQEQAAAGQRNKVIASQVRAAAPLQRALNKAEMDAEIASRQLSRARNQPGSVARVLENVGVGSTKIGAIPRGLVGAGLGYLGVMSYEEAIKRWKAGDESAAVLKALQAGAAGAAMLPPVGKTLTRARGLGGLGVLSYAPDLAKRLFRERPPE